jgi:hypothetical protein
MIQIGTVYTIIFVFTAAVWFTFLVAFLRWFIKGIFGRPLRR